MTTALKRHFQVNLHYELPINGQLTIYYDDLLSRFPGSIRDVDRKYYYIVRPSKRSGLSRVEV
ncbi:hypothetical protein FM107_17215 [Sphingobacterium sp. JB170]|nr:hypothetical protein FM107_17215 [Sphingobacterium sp. JB170]